MTDVPDPPAESLFTRYVLENPWPLGTVLVLVAVIVGCLGFREGRLERVRLALFPLALGVVVLAAGLLVVTSGERARGVTGRLVDAVVGRDLVGAVALFTDDVRIHLGSTRNVPHDIDFLRSGLSTLVGRFTIEDNRITRLRGYSRGRDTGTVHLVCWTTTDRAGPTPSQWVLEVSRQDDATWKISRLACITVGGRPPPSSF